MKKERSKKKNISMYLLALLLCATLFSMPVVGSIYARYTTSKNSSGNVKVVAFNITQEGTIFNSIETKVAPGTTQSATLKITNKSEGAIKYTLTVKNVTGNIPQLKFTLKPANVNTPSVEAESYENGISINSAVRRTIGDYTDEYYLNIVWEASSSEEADLALMGMVDYITISVTATQVE